jgi:hypothetical protein
MKIVNRNGVNNGLSNIQVMQPFGDGIHRERSKPVFIKSHKRIFGKMNIMRSIQKSRWKEMPETRIP